jgi:tRNA 2-thiouridine synthesizing protein A
VTGTLGTPGVVDARGLRCPMPVIELQRAAQRAADGAVLTLLADDPAAVTDVPAWCRMRGHILLSVELLSVEQLSVEQGEQGASAYQVQLRKSGAGSASADGSPAR